MAEIIICPKCGNRVVRGSTHCLHCGARLTDGIGAAQQTAVSGTKLETSEDSLHLAESTMTDMLATEQTSPTGEQTAETEEDVLPPIDEGLLPEPEAEGETTDTGASSPGLLEAETETADNMTWDVEDISADAGEGMRVVEKEATVAREIEADEVREGDPFREVAPPVVVDQDDDSVVTDDVVMQVLRDTTEDEEAVQAVAHLFPKGKGTTSREFVEVVVGKPKRIQPKEPMRELQTPSCPSCGAILTGDDFEYPGYVFEAMGRARMEHGDALLDNGDHEKAIEEFERAKKLFERAGNEKLVEEAMKRVDYSYEAMAESHFSEGESHLRADEFEWAIVQFKKAREIYMFTTRAKMRAKCSERIRKSYEEWGKHLEEEAERMAKLGDSRRALMLYQEAAEKYREANAEKRLRGLEKKIARV